MKLIVFSINQNVIIFFSGFSNRRRGKQQRFCQSYPSDIKTCYENNRSNSGTKLLNTKKLVIESAESAESAVGKCI